MAGHHEPRIPQPLTASMNSSASALPLPTGILQWSTLHLRVTIAAPLHCRTCRVLPLCSCPRCQADGMDSCSEETVSCASPWRSGDHTRRGLAPAGFRVPGSCPSSSNSGDSIRSRQRDVKIAAGSHRHRPRRSTLCARYFLNPCCRRQWFQWLPNGSVTSGWVWRGPGRARARCLLHTLVGPSMRQPRSSRSTEAPRLPPRSPILDASREPPL